MIDAARRLIGHLVTLPDGASGHVVAEYDAWQNEDGIHHGHRLRVAVTLPTCSNCPHGGGPATRYVTVDAEDVAVR